MRVLSQPGFHIVPNNRPNHSRYVRPASSRCLADVCFFQKSKSFLSQVRASLRNSTCSSAAATSVPWPELARGRNGRVGTIASHFLDPGIQRESGLEQPSDCGPGREVQEVRHAVQGDRDARWPAIGHKTAFASVGFAVRDVTRRVRALPRFVASRSGWHGCGVSCGRHPTRTKNRFEIAEFRCFGYQTARTIRP